LEEKPLEEIKLRIMGERTRHNLISEFYNDFSTIGRGKHRQRGKFLKLLKDNQEEASEGGRNKGRAALAACSLERS